VGKGEREAKGERKGKGEEGERTVREEREGTPCVSLNFPQNNL